MGKGSAESRSKAQKKYDANNCVHVSLKLNRKTDAKVIAKLQTVESKQGYLIDLVKADIGEEVGE